MKDFILPSDGSILVVDDKAEDALPLIEVLSSKGLACTYYSGDNDKLPSKPTQKVRLAFFDIQLFGPSDARSYAANILRLIDRLIPIDNGPYILALWTTIASDEADQVEQQIKAEANGKKPFAILRLEKTNYFETKSDNSLNESVIHEIQNSLSSRFPPEDIKEIQRVVGDELLPVRASNAVLGAIEKISEELNSKLQNSADSFQLFTHWESAINKAAGATIKDFSSLNETNDHWSNNLKNVILRLARAQLGQNISNVANDVVLKNAIKTMNGTLLDLVEHHYPDTTGLSEDIRFDKSDIQFSKAINSIEYKIKWKQNNKYSIYINSNLIPASEHGIDLEKIANQGQSADEKHGLAILKDAFLSIKPSINAKLLIDTNVSQHVQPGNLYLKHVPRQVRRQHILKNYYKDKPEKKIIWDKDGNFLLTSAELKKFKFVELEASPICDYAQDKWIKYRLIPGVMIPEKYCDDLNTGASFYHEIPLVKFGQENYRIVFDFRLLKSVDKDKHTKKTPILRFRSELSSSILSRLSSHASRIGITTLE